ncbi:MAG TPA: nucleotide exchange factor GrpE [Firmicutes bacterium]|nr:nucleotide exchange factor GrpE [Bacillota bacterium]
MAEKKEEKKDMEHAGEEQQRLNQEEETLQEKEAFSAQGSEEPAVSQEGEEVSPISEAGEPENWKEDAADGGSEEESAEALLEELRQTIAAREEEINELSNRLLRLQADFDNYRKRVRTEKEEQTQYANFNLVKKLLPVIDNMERACSSHDANPHSIIEGLELILKNLLDILEKEGVTAIDCKGKPFDPNYHEAVATEASSQDFPANTVLEEFQKGYIMNGRVLRASMVKVAVE